MRTADTILAALDLEDGSGAVPARAARLAAAHAARPVVLHVVEAAPALIRLCRNRRVGLLAIGPHGRGVVLQALLGSATGRGLGEAGCDVLVAGSR